MNQMNQRQMTPKKHMISRSRLSLVHTRTQVEYVLINRKWKNNMKFCNADLVVLVVLAITIEYSNRTKLKSFTCTKSNITGIHCQIPRFQRTHNLIIRNRYHEIHTKPCVQGRSNCMTWGQPPYAGLLLCRIDYII